MSVSSVIITVIDKW